MHVLVQTLDATWSPFVLVAGLLLIGHVSAKEGLFELVGSWCARVPGGGVALFVSTMAVVAIVTAVLNLDTSVVFMTPVALNAARTRNVDETSFLFGTIFMSNSASLLLVGSNLTNLLVFERRGVLGATFAHRMFAPWLVSISVTMLVVVIWRWAQLRAPLGPRPVRHVRFAVGPGVVATGFAVVTMLVLTHPAPWIFGAGIVAEVVASVVQRRVSLREVVNVTNPLTLSALFFVATVVGYFARTTSVTAGLLRHANVVTSLAVSGIAAMIINNLPAASFVAAHDLAHPYAVLFGLDLAPNCVITGALSSLLWFRIARANNSPVSLRTFSMVGTVVAVVAITGAVLV